METKFKVVMQKDNEVMKDFISFTYRAQGSNGRLRTRILAAGLVVIGYLAIKGGSTTAGIVIGAIGMIFVIMSLFLPQIAVWKLKKTDLAYQNQTELSYVFTNSNIYVYENGELTQNVGGYNTVSCFYGDEKNYYLGVNNEDLYLLPKTAFVDGDEKEFLDFIERRSDEKLDFLPTTVKNKWFRYRANAKQKEMEYDKRAAELKAKDKEKKEQKRKNKQ